jgi:hypothetical protein
MLPSGPHAAVGSTPFSLGQVDVVCHACGLVAGTNRGRCVACLAAVIDDRLSRYCDFVAQQANRPDLLTQVLTHNGPLLLPQ